MFTKRSLSLTFIGASAVGLWHMQLQATGPQVAVSVLHCHDGDTCRVKVNDAVWFNVRLAGIDAPELKSRGKPNQPFAEQAKDFVTDKLKAQPVMMRQTDLDRYNRPVVEFYVAGKLFNVQLVKAGLAEAYRGKTKRLDKSLYTSAEEAAQKEKLGIWSLESYQRPADYRRK